MLWVQLVETTWLLTWGSPLPFLSWCSHRAWKRVGLSPVTPVSSGAWEPWVSVGINTCNKITSEVGASPIHVGEVACPMWDDNPHSVK